MKAPSKRQKECRFAMPFQGRNMDQVSCIKKQDTDDTCYVTDEECITCKNFKHKYIQYPLTIDGIEYDKIPESHDPDVGKFVRIAPCAPEYKDKTYLGLYLGRLPISQHVSHSEKTNKLNIGLVTNPAIYVFDLHKIIYGMESYWNIIDDPENIKDITQKDINSQWYIQMLNAINKGES